MKELEFLEIIKKTLSKNSYIGDDCAWLRDLGIVITQDSLVEDIHFSLKYSTPYLVAYKAVIVNLSDILASGAVPKYLTISLSLPKNINNNFVTEFYKACEDLSNEFDFEIIGGDITGGSKCFISICAIGLTRGRNISSRKNAKISDYIVTTGVHGSSAAGLHLLNKQKISNSKHKAQCDKKISSLIKAHLMPTLAKDFSAEIAKKIKRDYAMMDTSDGLVDALFKIAQSSNVTLSVDFNKIPYDKEIEKIAKVANIDYKGWVLYGGEDYQLVTCLDKENLEKIDTSYSIIGQVKEKIENNFVEVNYNDKVQIITNLEQTFNHFKDNT